MNKKKLVIIGGGFAGLNVASKIDKKIYDVVVIDRNNYHSFPPLFYQVASSGLEPASISFPLRREMIRPRYKGCAFHMGEVTEIDFEKHIVHTSVENISYDTLVIAAGTTNNFFNMPDLKKKVYTLKSTSEAIRCRNEILDRLERASVTDNAALRKRLLTFCVVGGGPTGVEIAGAIGEFKRYALKKEYPELDPSDLRIIIIEGNDRLLSSMTPRSSAEAAKALGQLMVEVKTGIMMKSYENGVLSLSDGTAIDTDTVIWTAGVTGVGFTLTGTDVKPSFGGRFEVDEFNAVKGLQDVYAIGDISLHMDEQHHKGLPQVAPVAIQQGRTLAKNLNKPEKRKPFVYHDKGSMATVGRNRAVVDIGKVHFNGWFAWLVWMFIHLISLMGMRNKIVVMVNWITGYFTYSSGLRLLLRPGKYPLRHYWEE